MPMRLQELGFYGIRADSDPPPQLTSLSAREPPSRALQ